MSNSNVLKPLKTDTGTPDFYALHDSDSKFKATSLRAGTPLTRRLSIRLVREFNDHLMTFNGGRSVELFESKEVKLLIFTLISFILGMQKKQEQTHETAAALAKENEKVNIRDDQETLEKIKKLISLCDRGLTKHP